MIWPLPEEDQDGERKAKEIRRKGSVVNKKEKERNSMAPTRRRGWGCLPVG